MKVAQRFIGLRNKAVLKALQSMGIDGDLRRVIIDLPFDDAAVIYIETFADAESTVDLLEALQKGKTELGGEA